MPDRTVHLQLRPYSKSQFFSVQLFCIQDGLKIRSLDIISKTIQLHVKKGFHWRYLNASWKCLWLFSCLKFLIFSCAVKKISFCSFWKPKSCWVLFITKIIVCLICQKCKKFQAALCIYVTIAPVVLAGAGNFYSMCCTSRTFKNDLVWSLILYHWNPFFCHISSIMRKDDILIHLSSCN